MFPALCVQPRRTTHPAVTVLVPCQFASFQLARTFLFALSLPQVVTCSGRDGDGSLRVIRNGIGINKQAAVELSGIKVGQAADCLSLQTCNLCRRMTLCILRYCPLKPASSASHVVQPQII